MKKRPIIIVGCILGYIIYAVSTGGVVVAYLKNFGAQRNVTFTKDLSGDLWIDQNRSGGGIPFVGFFYFTHLPCAIRVQIWDTSRKYTEINIENITIKYKSGEKYTYDTHWIRKLKPYTEVNSSSQGLIKTPMFMLSDTTPKVINHHFDCMVTLTGVMTTIHDEQIPFEVTKSFEHKFKFGMATFWRMLASR